MALIAIFAIPVLSASATQQTPSAPASQQPSDAPVAQPSSSHHPNLDENGIYGVGNGVTVPAVIYSVEPQFSEEARKRKFAVDMFVEFIVDSEGHPYDVLVTKTYPRSKTSKRDLAAIHSLEPKAVETVKQYRFKPATFRGNLSLAICGWRLASSRSDRNLHRRIR